VTDRLGLAAAPARRAQAMQSLLEDVAARIVARFRDTPARAPANFPKRRYPRRGVSALVSPANETREDVRDV
jgi:hypothetical protein